MVSFKDLSNLSLERKGMSMPTWPWLLDFLAKPTVIRSPLLSHQKKRGRRWFMGVAFPLVQSLHGEVLHECIQGIFSLPFPGALFRRALLFASLSSRLSNFFAPPPPLFFSRPCLPRCFFLARASIAECIGTSEHPLVIVVANPLAAAGICELPFASYRSLKPNEHLGQ